MHGELLLCMRFFYRQNIEHGYINVFQKKFPTQRYSRFITRNSTQRYCSVEVVSPVLKVEAGLCLLNATLVASYLLLPAGDICENPGPETRSVNAEAGNLLNIPVVTSNRLNYSRPFNRPTARSLVSISIVKEQYRCARRHLRLCCLNARSINNKSADFVCYASSTSADNFAITESWLSERDMANKTEIKLPGYKLFEHQRVGRTGGGIALLLNEAIDVRKVDSGERRSFEFGE